MTTFGHPYHGSVSERSGHWSRRALITEGLLVGAIAGVINMAAIFLAPWWVVELTGFLTAPVLLASAFVQLPGDLTAALMLVVGSMGLYAGYATLLVLTRSEQMRGVWIMLVLLLHMACLIAWIGLFLSKVVAGALAF